MTCRTTVVAGYSLMVGFAGFAAERRAPLAALPMEPVAVSEA